MESRLVQFSQVVTGKTHNPTILNPDFLANEGIVPKSWGWVVEDTITTPPFAMVRYDSGVVISVEMNKLQVVDSNVEQGPESSKATEIATGYVRTLQHAHYSAAGNNFQSALPQTSAGEFLKQQFLKAGPWNDSKRPLDTLALKFGYELRPGRLSLSIDSGEATIEGEPKSQAVLVANANFNRSCDEHPSFEQVASCLGRSLDDWTTYQSILAEILSSSS